MSVIVEGACVRLRHAGPDDRARLHEILTEPSVAAWWGTHALDELDQLLDGADPRTTVFVVEVQGRTVGLLYASEELDPDYRHGAIDVTLAEDAQDRGLGTDAVRAAVRWLFAERGHHRVTIDPAATNDRAIACYRKVGFRPVGILRAYERGPDGTWHDGLLMDLLADEFGDATGPTHAP